MISWRFVGKGPLTPRVIHPVGAGQYLGAGTGPSTPGAGLSQLSGPLPLNLPIKRGDLFGFDFAPGSGIWNTRLSPGGAQIGWEPPLADSGPPRATTG